MTQDYSDFAKLLDGYLRDQDRSASWLARKIGVKDSTVSKWRGDPPQRPGVPEVVDRIAKAFALNAEQRKELFQAAGYGYLYGPPNSEKNVDSQENETLESSQEKPSALPSQIEDGDIPLGEPNSQSRDDASISYNKPLALPAFPADQEDAVASLPPASYKAWQQVLKKIIGQGRLKWVGGLALLLIAVMIWLLNIPATQERLQSLRGNITSPTLAATPKSVSLAEKTPTSPPTSTLIVAPTDAQTTTPIATPALTLTPTITPTSRPTAFSFSGTSTDSVRPTTELFEDSSLSFVPANDDEVLIVIANFRDESESITYDIASRIEDAILEKIPTENIPHLRIERLEQAFKGNERELAQRIAGEYGASVFIWGHYDDGGAFPEIEVAKLDSATAFSETISLFPAASLSSSNLGVIGGLPLQNLIRGLC